MNPSLGAQEAIAVLVIDDQESFRQVAAEMLAASDGFVLFGTAGGAREGRDAIAAGGTRPDLALVDVRLGDESGVELAAQLHQLAPEMAIVLISTLSEDELPPGAATCGALGFLPKLELAPEALRRLWERHRSHRSRVA